MGRGLTILLVALTVAVASARANGPPQRIVSVGGSLTEIVFALNAEDRLVAVDATSSYPPRAEALPDIGYMRQLAAEPILAMAPDLVLLVEDAGPKRVIDQLRAAGLAMEIIPDEPTPEGVRVKIARVSDALGLAERGRALTADFDAAQAALARRLDGVGERPRVLFLLAIGSGAPLAAGRDTSAASIIALAGGTNALDAFEGYKPLAPEAAAAARPDVLLVTEGTLERLGGAAALLARPEIASSPAASNGRLIAMDALLLLGFGPRTPQAATILAEALHPGLAAPR